MATLIIIAVLCRYEFICLSAMSMRKAGITCGPRIREGRGKNRDTGRELRSIGWWMKREEVRVRAFVVGYDGQYFLLLYVLLTIILYIRII